eukprot:GGOE01006385.1.p5 GENE.GGOE01006385.1~~GGOE01006385.1.p5  ORF type:complete len:112 (-),score=22.43 GGOE01006385.1:850-1185(-)
MGCGTSTVQTISVEHRDAIEKKRESTSEEEGGRLSPKRYDVTGDMESDLHDRRTDTIVSKSVLSLAPSERSLQATFLTEEEDKRVREWLRNIETVGAIPIDHDAIYYTDST